MSLRTPNNIEILIHCHCCSSQHPRHNATAVQQGLLYLANEGLIVRRDKTVTFMTTDKGAAHLSQLCNLEFPRQVWVNNMGIVL